MPTARCVLLIVLGWLGAAAATAQSPAQHPSQDPPRREVPVPGEFVTSQDDNLFSLQRSHDDIHEFEQALDELRNAEFGPAVARLHKLLQKESGGVVPVAPGRFYGLRLAVLATLANLPPAGQQAVDALASREAGPLGAAALPTLLPEQLELLAHRFPTAALGRAARARLGDLCAERGDGLRALGHYRILLDTTPIGSAAEGSAAARWLTAEVLREPRPARAQLQERRLPASGAEVLDALPPASDPRGASAMGGGGDGCLPGSLPAGRPSLVFADEVAAPGFDGPGAFAMHPTGDLEGIYVNTGRQLLAFDLLRRTLAWGSRLPMQELGRGRGDDDPNQINQDQILAASYSGDVVVAALQVPDRSSNVDFLNGYRIISKLPLRRLFAFSRRTGKELWAHFDELDGARTRRYRGHDVCGPPLCLGDTVYVPIHDRSGAIAFSIAAYDLHTGVPRWRRLVCSSQQEVNMFGNARSEFAASPLAAHGGVLYGAANLGVVFALEQASGHVRWITSHEVVRMPATQFRGQQARPVYFANNQPVVRDGVLCCTPLDSPAVLAFAAETGRLLWRLPAEATLDGVGNDVRWLCGALDDEFVLAGRGAVAVRAWPSGGGTDEPEVRQLVRPDQLRERGESRAMGRPALSADHVWFPGPGRVVGFDRAGTPVAEAKQLRTGRTFPGNLLFVDGAVIALRQRELAVFADLEALQAQATAELASHPDDPAAHLRLAALRQSLLPADAPAAARTELVALLRSGLAAALRANLPLQHPLRQTLQSELHDLGLAAGRQAAESGNLAAAATEFAAARDVAPEPRAWLAAQVELCLVLRTQPARCRAELDRLLAEGTGQVLVEGLPVPVAAFGRWQLALLPDTAPQAAVQLWQELLERFGDTELPTGPVRDLAQQAITRLLATHGAGVYAEIAARADAALAKAGDDATQLQQVVASWPNSSAAATARQTLLDRAVAGGDLAAACRVLGAAVRSGALPPRLLRAVQVAALQRGNRALAAALGSRLAESGDQPSTWPADQGRPHRAIQAELAPQLADPPAPATLAVPRAELGRVLPRSAREVLHLRPVLHPSGFTQRPDEPLYVFGLGELLAVDVHAPGARKPILFTWPVQLVEHFVVCGDLLLVPDLERLVALDYRTGQLRWELPNPTSATFDSLGVQHGVLHVTAQGLGADAGAELFGIEPLTGEVLFALRLPTEPMKPVPKASGGHLLLVSSDAQGARIARLDPLTGVARSVAPLALADAGSQSERGAAQPLGGRLEGLAARLFPIGLFADAERSYLPLDGLGGGQPPELLALDDRGTVVWRWRGRPQHQFAMVARRGDRIALVETAEAGPGRFVLLRAADGGELQQTPLGHELRVLNWQRTWVDNPAPAALLVGDAPEKGSRERRLLCLGIDTGMPSFVEPLAADDSELERQPLFGPDFLLFGARPAQRGSFRLHAIRLGDRSGAFPGGLRFRSLRANAPQGMVAVGPFTAIACADGILLCGDDTGR
ncbi:MAG: PQQ-binding-like beta-propeller repeat protein [Planctomycetes bacterium]|nr:PQQ-binding-like beta-propeller repeat protein [Planctomycetota bacterium]